jgi:hypothetical protein
MKKQKLKSLNCVKESPAARKKRAASGVKFRAAVFESRRRKLREKALDKEANAP